MSPLHFGHSIESSLVAVRSCGEAKQEPNQFLSIRKFNMLGGTYLLPGGLGRELPEYKNVQRVIFLFKESRREQEDGPARDCPLASKRTSARAAPGAGRRCLDGCATPRHSPARRSAAVLGRASEHGSA